MYKLARWLYATAVRNEHRRLKSDILVYFSYQPVRIVDADRGIKESDEHYKKRIDGWFIARQMLDDYFNDTEQKH
jgi:hypothetical protein